MGKGALALLINGGSENWSSARWKARFDAVCPDRPVVLLPDGADVPDRLAPWPAPASACEAAGDDVDTTVSPGLEADASSSPVARPRTRRRRVPDSTA